MNLYEEFKWRGVLYDATEGTEELLAREKVTLYIGFDPTAASLHVGSLLPIMGLARAQKLGHTPIAIVGGGTGLIGDPSGKTKERQLLTKEQVEENLLGIKEQLSRFLDFSPKLSNAAKIINNYDWLGKVPLIDFLRDIGKHFTVNYMMAKESIKTRTESEEGITFTEFSYLLLQAYDFYELYQRENCVLQMGGSDQWGNIVAGVELIRRKLQGKAYGLVFPLVTSSTGVKFGKTEAGNVWLDSQLTSPYRFYQFWYNVDDADVIRYLKYFTWLSAEEIASLEVSLREHPEKREAQTTLAKELTRMVHGESELQKAIQASRVLFGGSMEGLSGSQIEDIFHDVPSVEIPLNELENSGMPVVEMLVRCGIANGKGEARRLIQGGGIYLNNERVTDIGQMVTPEDAIDGTYLVLRKGRKNFFLVRLV
ncbi:MAG: tyrosine--tRNA ligase [Calditrichaeota bacterium]|nr:MAG: tyrosine--tRNA ligase [Calditrichota bacterium]